MKESVHYSFLLKIYFICTIYNDRFKICIEHIKHIFKYLWPNTSQTPLYCCPCVQLEWLFGGFFHYTVTLFTIVFTIILFLPHKSPSLLIIVYDLQGLYPSKFPKFLFFMGGASTFYIILFSLLTTTWVQNLSRTYKFMAPRYRFCPVGGRDIYFSFQNMKWLSFLLLYT